MTGGHRTSHGGNSDDGTPMSSARLPLLILMLAVVATSGLVIATRLGNGEPPERQENEKAVSDAPTSADVRRVFNSLNRARLDAYRKHDLQRLRRTFTVDSPVRRAMLQELRNLKIDSIQVIPRMVTRRLSVTRATGDEVHVRQIVMVNTAYRDENGNDVTVGRSPERQTVDWVLRQQNGQWRMHKGVVTDVVELQDES